MGCLRLSYHSTQGALEQVPIFHLYPLEKNDSEQKNHVNYYTYAYNGMEVDPETKGNGNSYTTEFRQYDPRLGRWLSLDPLMMDYPEMSPYCAFNNNPINFVDPEGLEGVKKGDPDEGCGGPDDVETNKNGKVRKKDKIKITEIRQTQCEDYVPEQSFTFKYDDEGDCYSTTTTLEAKTIDGEWVEYNDPEKFQMLEEKRELKRGFYWDGYIRDYESYDRGERPKGGATVLEIYIGKFGKNIKGGNEPHAFRFNQRQKDRYALRAHKHNQRVVKKLNRHRGVNCELSIGDIISWEYKGYTYKSPDSFRPIFYIHFFAHKQTLFKKYHPDYRKGSMYKKAKEIRALYDVIKGIYREEEEEEDWDVPSF